MRPQSEVKNSYNMYPECVDGLGEFKKFEYHIELDPYLSQEYKFYIR